MIALALPFAVKAQSLPMVTVQTGADGTQTWSLSIQILLLMTALTLLPAILLMMTSFTRIIIVLSFMRQAIGSAQTPPNQVLLGLRSAEHTSELQSLMRIAYAVFCLKNKN